MKLRDPKLDPRPGDIVAVRGEIRDVVAITTGGAIVYTVCGQERMCCLRSWTGWAKGQMAPLPAGAETVPA